MLGAILALCMELFFAAAHVEFFPLLWFCIYRVNVCFIKALSDFEFLCSKFGFPTM